LINRATRDGDLPAGQAPHARAPTSPPRAWGRSHCGAGRRAQQSRRPHQRQSRCAWRAPRTSPPAGAIAAPQRCANQPIRYCLLTPELQWQSRGTRRISQGCGRAKARAPSPQLPRSQRASACVFVARLSSTPSQLSVHPLVTVATQGYNGVSHRSVRRQRARRPAAGGDPPLDTDIAQF
jgi:hypothetical protein